MRVLLPLILFITLISGAHVLIRPTPPALETLSRTYTDIIIIVGKPKEELNWIKLRNAFIAISEGLFSDENDFSTATEPYPQASEISLRIMKNSIGYSTLINAIQSNPGGFLAALERASGYPMSSITINGRRHYQSFWEKCDSKCPLTCTLSNPEPIPVVPTPQPTGFPTLPPFITLVPTPAPTPIPTPTATVFVPPPTTSPPTPPPTPSPTPFSIPIYYLQSSSQTTAVYPNFGVHWSCRSADENAPLCSGVQFQDTTNCFGNKVSFSDSVLSRFSSSSVPAVSAPAVSFSGNGPFSFNSMGDCEVQVTDMPNFGGNSREFAARDGECLRNFDDAWSVPLSGPRFRSLSVTNPQRPTPLSAIVRSRTTTLDNVRLNLFSWNNIHLFRGFNESCYNVFFTARTETQVNGGQGGPTLIFRYQGKNVMWVIGGQSNTHSFLQGVPEAVVQQTNRTGAIPTKTAITFQLQVNRDQVTAWHNLGGARTQQFKIFTLQQDVVGGLEADTLWQLWPQRGQTGIINFATPAVQATIWDVSIQFSCEFN